MPRPSVSDQISIGTRNYTGLALATVLEIVARTVGDTADADKPLMEAGLDSLGAVELRNLLQQATGGKIALPSTIIFEQPTVRQLSQHLDACACTSVHLEPRDAGPSESGHSRSKEITPSLCMGIVSPNGAESNAAAWLVAAAGSDAVEPCWPTACCRLALRSLLWRVEMRF